MSEVDKVLNERSGTENGTGKRSNRDQGALNDQVQESVESIRGRGPTQQARIFPIGRKIPPESHPEGSGASHARLGCEM